MKVKIIENYLMQLQVNLILRTNINLIEVYDNSHIQGTNSVGALIAYGDEGFIKKRYRKFNIKIEKNEQDDYGMIREVLNEDLKELYKKKIIILLFQI